MSVNGIGQEEPSPHDDAPVPKRRRIAFSCRDCRRRKLRCDRIFPSCSRCQKGGQPESCTYDSEAVESTLTHFPEERNRTRDCSTANGFGAPRVVQRPSLGVPSFKADEGAEGHPRFQSDDTAARLNAQEERIRQLEHRIIGLEKATHDARRPERAENEPRPYSEPKAAVDKDMIFRGKDFKTQFCGASHHTSYLSHLPELRLFINDMVRRHHEVEPLQKQLKNAKIKGSGQIDNLPIEQKALISLLPPKDFSDQLIQIYVDNLESTYRVLHLPSFWEEYAHFWKAPQEGRPAFAAILLLILASTYCIKEANASMFRGDSSVGRETAILWIRTCDSWLQTQSQKHTTMATFQIHCLSFIAKRINSFKRKQTWTSAGNLTRLALSSGLHRDAQIVNSRHSSSSRRKVSIFDQEMRRRIWATISELELLTSFERGMPTMLRDLFEDCGSPLNVDDEELDPSADQFPSPGPISNYTRSSFQRLSRSSWSLRLELVSVINRPYPQMAYEDVLMYDKKITQHLDEIPQWSDKASLVSRVLLQLQLLIFLLLLHRPYAREEAKHSRYEYSAAVHLRSAMRVLDLHEQLMDLGNNFLCLFRNDVFGASLSICYNYSTSELRPDLLSRNPTKPLSSDPLQYLEKALNMTGAKIMCIGIGLQEYYCVCASIGLLKKMHSPEHLSDEEQKAAYRVAQIIQKLLSLQDNYATAATPASLPRMPVSALTSVPINGHSNGANNINGSGSVNEIGSNGPIDSTGMLEAFDPDLESLDFNNFAEWDLEAFWNF